MAYEDRDVINMLADVSGDEVEAYLLKAGMVQPTAASADQPRGCHAHHHE